MRQGLGDLARVGYLCREYYCLFIFGAQRVLSQAEGSRALSLLPTIFTRSWPFQAGKAQFGEK